MGCSGLKMSLSFFYLTSRSPLSSFAIYLLTHPDHSPDFRSLGFAPCTPVLSFNGFISLLVSCKLIAKPRGLHNSGLHPDKNHGDTTTL